MSASQPTTAASRRRGIPTGTLHALRHTAATLALTSGVPVHIVAARLGDNPKTVLGTYAHHQRGCHALCGDLVGLWQRIATVQGPALVIGCTIRARDAWSQVMGTKPRLCVRRVAE
jgi:hypothetical protein